ncbi:hypothetical protein SprV_0802618600 [Sparganum proliferum]
MRPSSSILLRAALLYLTATFVSTTQPSNTPSNGLENNVVTSADTCVTVVSSLPEKLTNIRVDSRAISCGDGHCRSRGDDYIQFKYKQEKVGKNYQAEATICRHGKMFRIAWEVEGFKVTNRLTRITQFLVPNGCIQPQYSMPLIRNVTDGSTTQVQCAISKKNCYNQEDVVIFDQDTVFCEYNTAVQTCERREVDADTIVFTANISRAYSSKYFPDHYVFCNSKRSDVSMKLVWNTEPPIQPLNWSSNGREDNIVTSPDKCVSIVSKLPEKATHIHVDSRPLSCDEKRCKSRGDDNISFGYKQEKVGKNYQAEATICRHDKIFRIAWEVEGFEVKNKLTRITQFLVPNGCIQPQYSMPLIRNVTDGSTTQVQCAISKKNCYNQEDVVIFDQDTVFCEYNTAVQTCVRDHYEAT